jgi:hypothetical protein
MIFDSKDSIDHVIDKYACPVHTGGLCFCNTYRILCSSVMFIFAVDEKVVDANANVIAANHRLRKLHRMLIRAARHPGAAEKGSALRIYVALESTKCARKGRWDGRIQTSQSTREFKSSKAL